LVIIHTCAVTAEAERQARQAIRAARRRRPTAEVVVTGCAAQIAPNKFAAMPEVDRVLGNREKLLLESWARRGEERVAVGDILSQREMNGQLVSTSPSRTRAVVEVQNGCDHRCTFCVIPFGRGASRSVPARKVILQVQHLRDTGVKEVVLSGVDLTAYGQDLPERPTLGSLVRAILEAVPDLPRLRLSSLDPAEIDEDLWSELATQPRLMPHLHLSLQSGDDLVLKRMRRRHTRAQAVSVARRAQGLRPDVALGADLIAGFPLETEAAFEQTLALLADCNLVYLHVFPYSARPGTPAGRLPQLPRAVRRERAAVLRSAGQERLAAFLSRKIGTSVEVLMESNENGRARDFAPVLFEQGPPAGELARVCPTRVEDGRLVAERETAQTPATALRATDSAGGAGAASGFG
jgi:threonylcarbamoyladenosine tRNA methylthiotransferase MtaB